MRSSAAHPLREGEELYFEIGTADGAVGVRGTSVWVKKDNNGTQALAIDSGKDEVTSGAAAITVTGTGVYAIDRKEAKLGQSVLIASSNPVVVVNPSIFSTEAIYAGNTRPLIRAATLRDLADYRSLQDGVGNLHTISMTGSWLRSRDIYSLSVVAGAIGIDITDPNKAFVDREFANTLPTTPTEKTNLCKNISGDIAESIQPSSIAVG